MNDLKPLIEIMKDMTPEQREKFMDFVLKLIERDNSIPIENDDIGFDTTTYLPTIASGNNYFLFTAE